MPQTLHEIESAEQARLERAYRYGQFTDMKVRAEKNIARMTKEGRPDAGVLRQMFDLAGQVSPDLTTAGDRIVPGGFQVRDVLIKTLADAITHVGNLQRKFDAKLAQAQKDLSEADAALATFTD